MTDRYSQLINTPLGRVVSKQVGLPTPAQLERYTPGQPVIHGPVLVGGAPGGRLGDPVRAVLAEVDAKLAPATRAPDDAESNGDGQTFKALVFDATGITESTQLREAYEFFHPAIRRVRPSGRIIVLGTPPEACPSPREATAQRALEGLVRSLGKEVKKGATAQLVYVSPGAEGELGSSLRFFLSPKSAYVSGQVVRVGPAEHADPADWERPLAGKVALVTGASRGIGEAIAETLARDGAHVVGLDVPALADELSAVTDRVGGSPLTLDITAADSPGRIAEHLMEAHGGVDIVVHNAGVTRDKTLGRMVEDQWTTVIDINLSSEERINDELLERGAIRENGRIVCVSSMNGIAGNAGQTNYATSKAGVIGMVQSLAPVLAERKLTINAVAPGFIETKMTAAMPIALREAGRRMNSLSQGGLPVDVAETIAWFANPASSGVNGNVVRVCGQSLIGA
ncbi:MAG TPA: 3-oxoacyl-ACP reductase [Solirubrobacteraceae bacterium]|jgi:3-oxoacyl-[acyl-carrier protein] reductase|nr:3-oxoacyl-ACP reductase [Solirubrobacteraceae bacterium]